MRKQDDARVAWGRVARLFLSVEVHERLHEAATAAGVPHPGALKLLLHIDARETPSMRELASFLKCDASWVTALVDELEAAGHVERHVSPTDRRVKLVHLTDAGRDAQERALDVLATPPKAMERLNAVETKTLARLLGHLLDD